MSLLPMNLHPDLKKSLENFAESHDFAELYRGYRWGMDSWENGFPDILKLEERIAKVAKNNLVKREDILAVAKWGRLRNPRRVQCLEVLALPFYHEGKVERNPLIPLNILQVNIQGLGPTYLSKVLRFALPWEFGALDTRIVRVLGHGNRGSEGRNWLSLKVRNDGYGWYIPKTQAAWPGEYSKWIDILRFFSNLLNNLGTPCPHPEGFPENNLRVQGVWACADVEMALFAYAAEYHQGIACKQ